MDGFLQWCTDEGLHFCEVVIRLLLVVLTSGLIGWERETKGQSAGLRTHSMVALGAALFTIVALEMSRKASGMTAQADITRVITGVAQGIGFLGAGMIFKEESKIKGLTTAATIWCMGALGIAWGIGAYEIAAASTVVIYLVLRPLRRFERHHLRRRRANGEPPLDDSSDAD